jgi:hypothetical protein
MTDRLAIRTVTVRVPELPVRAERLVRLARDVVQDPRSWDPEVVQILLASWATRKLSADQLAKAWTDLVEKQQLADDLNDGMADWRDVDPELVGDDRQDTAWLIADGDATDALHLVLYGVPAPRPATVPTRTARVVAA